MEPTTKTGLPAVASAKVGPRDVFLHLLAILTLYLSALALGTLLFNYIDLVFPDPLTAPYEQPRDPIRWALAALVIIFPSYLWLSWRLARDATTVPEKREMRIRKWLLYFTLSAASAVILGDLVALVYNFLSGELSTRFILKVLSVAFIAAAIFGYYLWNLRMEIMASHDPRMRWFVFGMIAVVAASVIAGFVAAGSPFEERMRKFDQHRVQNLQEIQWQIMSFWQRKEKLPASLDELRDPISGFAPATDPETGADYEYRVWGDLKFELCAVFKTASTEAKSRMPGPVYSGLGAPDNWAHGTGRACFERTIDPELYRLEKPAR